MYDPSKDLADSERVVSGLYAGKQGFRPGKSQPGAGPINILRKTETPRICPVFLMEPAILFSFLQLLYFISAFSSAEGGGTFHSRWLRPCSWAYQF